MATSREAAVRLTLSAGQFSAAMRQVADKVDMQWKALGQRMHKHVAAGMGGAKESLGQLGGHAKNALGMVGGLAAGFSFAGAIKHTLDLDSRLKTLSFRIKLATGETKSAAALQELFERKAAKTGRTVGDIADAFEGVYAATRDFDYSRDVLEAVSNTATATGDSIASIATVAHQMQRKFQLSATEVGDALAQVAQGAVQGGPSIAEFGMHFDKMGAVMLQSGMRGKQALGFIIGALNATDSEGAALGERISALQTLMGKLGNANQLTAIAKSLNISPNALLNEKDVKGRLSAILRHGEKGVEALNKQLEISEKSMARILFFDPFKDAVTKAQASGARGRDAVEQAVRSVEGQIAKFGEATVGAADIAAEAGNRQQDASRRLALAMDALNTAVARPEVVSAMEDLAAKAPEVASGFGKLLRWVIQNPILAGVMGVGGFAAKGFLANMTQSIVAGHIEGVKAWAAANQAGAARMAGALKVAGAGVAAMIAYEIGKQAIDAGFQESVEAQGKTAGALANTGSTAGGEQGARRRLADLEKALAAEREAGSGWSGFVEGATGLVARPFMDEGLKTNEQQRSNRMVDLQRAIDKERGRIAEYTTEDPGKRRIEGFEQAIAAERHGAALQAKLTGRADTGSADRIAELERKIADERAAMGRREKERADPRSAKRIAGIEEAIAAERHGAALQAKLTGKAADPQSAERIAALEKRLSAERDRLYGGGAEAAAERPKPETKSSKAVLDDTAPHAISLAVSSALKKDTLRVEVINWRGANVSTTQVASGSRGPMVVSRATPGGGN